MTPDAIERAARLLLQARRAGWPLAQLPEDCRPASLAEGYAIQDALLDGLGDRAVGFKIGATSEKAQRFLGVETPFSGRILAGEVHDSPARLAAGRFIFRLIEPEFAFRMGAALPAREDPYDKATVAAAVASLHPAIEIVASAYGETWSRAGAPALIADNGVHGAFVLGPACSDWRGIDLGRHPVRLTMNGETVGEGIGANALGGPLIALTWLVNQQRELGRDLPAGALVTTGVVTDFVRAEAGDRVVADYGQLGQVDITFTG